MGARGSIALAEHVFLLSWDGCVYVSGNILVSVSLPQWARYTVLVFDAFVCHEKLIFGQ